MDCLTFRIDEERLCKIHKGRRRDDSLIREAQEGLVNLPKLLNIQYTISIVQPDYTEWRNHISKELREPNSPSHVGTILNVDRILRKELSEADKKRLKEISWKCKSPEIKVVY